MTDYVPPNVWKWEEPTGGKFEGINRPISGSQRTVELQTWKVKKTEPKTKFGSI